MKKYKVKITCPDFNVGQILQPECYCFGTKIKCEDYPDIFEEIKEPLFITEDGKEIFELNGNLYEVSLPSYSYSGYVNLNEYEIEEFKIVMERSSKNHRYFFTKEAAEKYIDENKLIFSKKQLREAIGDHHAVLVDDLKTKLNL